MSRVAETYGAGATHRRLRGWVAPVGASVLAAAIVGVGFMLAIPARAVSLDAVADALQSAKAVHISRYFVDGSKLGEPYLQEWRQGSQYRIQGGTRYRVPPVSAGSDGTRGWFVSFDDKAVNIGADPMKHWANQIDTVDTLISQFRSSARDGVIVSRSKEGGVETVTAEGREKASGNRFRLVLEVMASSGLPIEQRKYNWSTSGKWLLRGLVKFDYPENISNSVFTPKIPDGFVVYDYDKVLAKVREALKTGDSQTVGGVTVTLLGAIQEQDGAVYVLWKGGATPPLFAKAAAYGSNGTQHVVDFFYEADDRSRPRNHGIAPKNLPPKIPISKLVIKLGPLGWPDGEPIYCLKFNPGQIEPNKARAYKVVIPVCVKTDPYIQQPAGWIKHQSTGREVGTATFRVETMPVMYWWWFFDKFDPDRMFNFSYYPATNIGMTREQIAAYRKEELVRKLGYQPEHSVIRIGDQ